MSVRKAARVDTAVSTAGPTTDAQQRANSCDDLDEEEEERSTSINPLFVLSGPRGGAIHPRSGDRQLADLVDVTEDAVLHVLRDALARVGVPADRYWRCPTPAPVQKAAHGLGRRLTSSANVFQVPRVPSPVHLFASFYPTRVEALASRGYAAHLGLVPLALDRKSGSGSKVFNVLPFWNDEKLGAGDAAELSTARIHHGSAIADFLAAIPHPLQRNLYVLVDEEAPVDPYFDIDFAFDASADDPTHLLQLLRRYFDDTRSQDSNAAFSTEAVERLLLVVLTTLREELEREFDSRVEECLVLTSSVQLCTPANPNSALTTAIEQLKISFHVHFRLAENTVFASVTEVHHFMVGLRARLEAKTSGTDLLSLLNSNSPPSDEVVRALTVLRCVDFGVYTRWRAFRLPYNVKAPEGRQVADGAGDDLSMEQLDQLGISVPDSRVGSVAATVLEMIAWSKDVETCKAQRFLMRRLMPYFRFLLPVCPGMTKLFVAGLAEFLRQLMPAQVQAAAAAARMQSAGFSHFNPTKVLSAWVMELSCIVRDASTTRLPNGSSSSSDGGDAEQPASAAFRLLRGRGSACTTATASGATFAHNSSNPFGVPLPPMPRSVRVRVDDAEIKQLLAEIFWCIAPEYGSAAAIERSRTLGQWMGSEPTSPIIPQRITAQYEDSIRAFYVMQKQNRYCLRQHRHHKATYAQLYVTFGSIKLRCYANDCCDRCCVIPWEAPEGLSAVPHRHEGYPKYERLAAIRVALFPPLSAEELVKRYGTGVLRQP